MVQGERDWKGGDRQYRIALKIRPTYGQAVFWMGNNQCYQGRIPEALMLVRQAQSLEPMSVPFAANVGLIQYFARDFTAAKERLSAIVATAPQYALARRYLVRVLLVRGEVREALTLLEGHEGDYVPGGLSDLGRALALDGQREGARREISRLETLGTQGFGVGYDMALIGVALGEFDQALAALERSVNDGSQGIGFLNSEPGLDAIRREPRFKAVSRAVGLG
jgi:Flp pilus assembly protein TadD